MTVLLLGAVITTCTLVGCGSTTPSPPPANPATSQRLAPTVAHPLNAAPFTSKPCTSLTTSDTTTLGLAGAQTADTSIAAAQPACSFTAGQKRVDVSWETADPHGLSDLYAQKSTMAYWKPMTIFGYPAVEADQLDERAAQGICVVHVGVTDQLFFFTTTTEGAADATKACPVAEQAAADVVRNVRARG
jgi:uncharacterized protein DUF3558